MSSRVENGVRGRGLLIHTTMSALSMMGCLQLVILSTVIRSGLMMPVAVVLYVALMLIEAAAHPYDVIECEPEVVSGYYVDHGGVSFMLIYLSEGMMFSRYKMPIISRPQSHSEYSQ